MLPLIIINESVSDQTKINVQPSKDEYLILTGHCPLTGRYLQP